MIFGGRRHFRELLNGSQEGIASTILANRLKRLVELGMLSKLDDPARKQKAIYILTRVVDRTRADHGCAGHLGTQVAAGQRLPFSEELSIRARVLEEGARTLGPLHGRTPAGTPRHPGRPGGRTVRALRSYGQTQGASTGEPSSKDRSFGERATPTLGL
jgi:hypothetical protein